MMQLAIGAFRSHFKQLVIHYSSHTYHVPLAVVSESSFVHFQFARWGGACIHYACMIKIRIAFVINHALMYGMCLMQ